LAGNNYSAMTERTCVVCGHPQSTVVFEEFGIDVLACQGCGHVYSSYKADQHYDGYFGEYVSPGDHFWWNEAHASMYASFCNRFLAGRKGRLLDVGCGLGFFVRKASSVPGWDVHGCDTSKAAVEFAQHELGLASVHHGPVQECGYPENHFDIATLWDVLEHVPEPDPLLSFLRTLLKADGMLFVHTPNVNVQLPKARMIKLLRGMNPRLHYLEARHHVNLYSMDTLRRVFLRCGYRDIKFIHLPPIQSLSGSRNRVLTLTKNAIFQTSRILFYISLGRVNLDNLFAVARS
jgi:2-polyprenyl-3-methyl-5-hydroxy-6-metoxy-1,4-benzoquinol methylase